MTTIEFVLKFNGKYSDVVLGMYIDSEMADDIGQTGWNLCDCDDVRHAALIGDCSIVSSNLSKGRGTIVISLDGTDRGLIEKTIQEYLNALGDYIRPVFLELRSRTGEKYDFTLTESNYEMKENT